MVDYKGPKLLGKSFPILVNLANDEPVPSEESYLTSSSEEEAFSDDSPSNINNIDVKLSLNDPTSNSGFTDVIQEVKRNIAYSCSKSTTQKNIIKTLVSKQKNRFGFDGFDLDLTYVTEKIIGMGFPSEKLESIYRNSMADVIKFFNLRHHQHYRIYNLCSERKYNHELFDKNVREFPFDDHNPPPFRLIFDFCKDVDEWLKENKENVAAIHCKAGKGRTGLMISCYLLYCKMFTKATNALKYYGMIRTKDKKGVTIPSQIRYVHYFEKALINKWNANTMPSPELKITKLKISPTPQINVFGGCEPWFIIQDKQKILYDSRKFHKMRPFKIEPFIEFNLEETIVKGDFCIFFYNNSMMNSKEKMFQCWFNTAFLNFEGILTVRKNILDGCKDKLHKKFSKNFEFEIFGKFLENSKNMFDLSNIPVRLNI